VETESPSRPASYPEKLLALRSHLGLTQAELAKLLGTSIVSINRWEKGHSTPSAPSWQRVQKLMASLAAPPAPQPNHAPQALDFAADPELVRTLVEGERLSYGHLFNAGFAAEISAIDPLPHQRIAVYGHMLAQSPLRFLLADDAGAGKTVMAGLYLREMLNRRRLRRILVVAPAGLTTNWRRELAQLFGLRFVIATGADAKANNPFIGPSSDQLIVSLDTLAADRMFSRLQEANVSPYDLVIMDEAHKLSARTENDGTVRRTDRYKLAEALAGVPVTETSEVANARWRLLWKPEHLLLLTATPHMGKDDPYFFLWRLLCPDLIPTLSAFQAFSQESRQRHFLRRTKEEMLHFDGRRLYPQRISDSFGFELSQSPVPAAQPWLGAVGPQAGASTSGTRGAAALGPAPTDDAPSEQLLYDRTTEYLRTFYNRAQILNQAAARLATGVFQRRLASSTFALLRSLERRSDKLTALIRSVKAEGTRPLAQLRLQWGDLRNLLDDATADEEQPEAGAEESERAEIRILETVVPATLADLELELAQVNGLVDLARAVLAAGHESKFYKLREIFLHPAFRGEKILVFTEHRDTLAYLIRRLEGLGFAGRIAAIHGGLNASQRDAQIELFRDPQGARFMIATDAGGEGINLQFCWLMINYDIPWNPARLEQRMGRVHRYGQPHDPVRIANLVATTTREGRVLHVLLARLEAMRDELSSDKVFDVVGRLLEGSSLVGYMESALHSEAGAAEAGNQLALQLTKSRVEEIIENDRRLFGPSGDVAARLPAERAKLDREELTRLLPGYLRAFLERAAPLLDLGFAGDLGATFSLRALRPGALAPLEAALEQYPHEYRERLTLHRPPPSAPGVFLRPGEPIFEALRELLIHRCGAEARRGAIFVDPQAARPYLLHLAHIQIERRQPGDALSARGNTLPGLEASTPSDQRERPKQETASLRSAASGPPELVESRWIAVRQEEDGQLALTPAESLLLLRGAGRPTTRALGLIARAPEMAAAARAFAEEHAAAAAARHRQAAQADLPERARELAAGFEHTAAELASRRVALARLLAASPLPERPLRAADLEAVKQDQRQIESRRALALAALHAAPQQFLPGPVRFLTHALVLPSSDPEDRRRYDAQVEQLAVQLACAHERALGAVVRDVSKPGLSLACGLGENPGFDLWSQRPDGQTLSIEVKGRAGAGDIELTPNEWRQASNRGPAYWLYVVYDCGSPAPRLWRVQDPFAKLLAQGAGVFVQQGEIFRHAESDSPPAPQPGGAP